MTTMSIRRMMGFPDRHWDVLCAPMMNLTDTESMEVIRRALILRQGIYLPVGASAEDIYRLRDLWTYAVMVTVMLCRDIVRMDEIPDQGITWLKDNALCMRHIQMALADPPAGMLHELIHMASGNTAIAKQETPSKKVQSELLQDSDISTDSKPAPSEDGNSLGDMFLQWLRKGIIRDEINVNKPGARIHIVKEGTLIISPKTFKDYDVDHWESVQRSLLSMGLHQPGAKNNLVTLKVKNADGVYLKGVLLNDVSLLFDTPPEINPALELH